MSNLTSALLHPYQNLTPDSVADALAGVGLLGDGRQMALNSYENRVYLAHLDQPLDDTLAPIESVVLKFYRPGRWSEAQIQEEHDFAAELAAAEIPVVAPMWLNGRSLHQHGDFLFSVSPCRGGRRPELDDPEVLEWIGRFLARIHNVGASAPFKQRPALDLQSFAIEPRDWLLSQQLIPLDVQGSWHAACDKAIEIIAKNPLFTQSKHQNVQTIRLHGDCHPGNILWTPVDVPGGGPHFVDMDDARSGPAVQDLWMLLSGERAERSLQLSLLLEGYEQLRPFNRHELALIEPLRTLRIIHYSAWLARRWQDPIFPANFPWFGSSDYWQGQVRALEEQIEAMAEPELVV